MTERGLPIVDGAAACPFVAFEDDRDERATSPDHRHRCYAEDEPAPRALAHQEAYCLSSSFPVCPTFQDWARREAARARPRDVPPPGLDADDEADADDDLGLLPPETDPSQRRNPQRNWSAPPPWMNREAGPGSSPGPEPYDDLDEDLPAGGGAVPPVVPAAAGGGLSGSFADRLASDRPAGAGPSGRGDEEAAAAWQHHDAWDDEIEEAAPRSHRDDAVEREPQDDPMDEAPPTRRRERERGMSGGDRDRDEAPSWERPRRLEAYPTLRSRRLPELVVPPLLLAVAAIDLAGLALFHLPGLLGIGSPQAGASPTPTLAGGSPLPTLGGPTIVAGPTPFIYRVQPGDTMSKIANKFHVPLATLIAANTETVPNPDILKIGDPVIIPTTTPTELPGASTAP
jgi:hypothetical protein